MIKEELLKPRYKIIANYPECHFHIGFILNLKQNGDDWIFTYSRHDGVYEIGALELDDYPHLL